MPRMHISVPDVLYLALKKAAVDSLRTLNAQILEALRLSVLPPKDDPAIEWHGIEDYDQARADVMREGPADARPDGLLSGLTALDGVGDEDGIVGHVEREG